MIPRPATEADIQPICDLVNHFAEQNLMLQRTPEQVRMALGDFLVVGDQNQMVGDQNQMVGDQNQVLGCGYIAHLSATLAEIRSLAVHPDHQGEGLGGLVVDHLVEMARARGVQKICALTLAPDFFYRQGFHRVNRWSISPKIWGECVYCPKFHACDEIAVLKILDSGE
ncbi:MAG TPA: GNAT family N-acetyltransferase [Caldilineae bacterium]|nr:GNAT family N-acetyltransferase [Caldilineae bacterium]